MESWRRTLSQLRDLLNNLAPGQRMTLTVVPLLVLAGLGLVMQGGTAPAEEALLSGKVFSADELKKAEAALRSGNFTQYRVAEQRILVAKTDAARYNAALVIGQGVPGSFGDDLEKAIADNNPLLGGGDAQHRDRIDLGKSRELVKIIKAIPLVDDASLVTDRPRRKIFHGEAKMSAVLAVKLRGGRELPGDLAQSLRQTVAGGFGMAPADVTVVDMETGKAPRQPPNNEGDGQAYVETLREFTAIFQHKIAEALAYIPNVLVSVNVELTQSSAAGGAGEAVVRNPAAGWAPGSVQVTVSVPKDYYRHVALLQGIDEADRAAFRKRLSQIKSETQRDLREKIARLVPASTGGTASDSINVSSYDRVEAADAPTAVPVTNRIGEVAMQWGGLALFAIWAMWMLNRNRRRMPDNPGLMAEMQASENTRTTHVASPAEQPLPADGIRANRTRLLTLVRENPKLAAAVLSGWLEPQRP
jgi:flagellar biosynthesis/type III secretory pathway M-ring protein FliF/YscJ